MGVLILDSLVSVIMSTYNEELDWVKKSIESILDQTYKNLEFIIVIDNPSNEPLIELINFYKKKDNRVSVIKNSENIGLVKSLNVALEHCNGVYIARMDADDISLETRISIEKAFLENNNCDFVFSSMIKIDEAGNYLYETNRGKLTHSQVKYLLENGNISNHPTWFCKKEVYEKLKGYREIPYCEDYDFSLRSLWHGFKIGKINESLLKYRVRNNSLSRSYTLEQFLNSRGILNLYKKGKLENSLSVSKLISKSKKAASESQTERYILAMKTYKSGVYDVKSGVKFNGFIKIIKCTIISKFIVLKYFDILKDIYQKRRLKDV